MDAWRSLLSEPYLENTVVEIHDESIVQTLQNVLTYAVFSSVMM